jgi:hypothetical protein
MSSKKNNSGGSSKGELKTDSGRGVVQGTSYSLAAGGTRRTYCTLIKHSTHSMRTVHIMHTTHRRQAVRA